MKRNSPSIMSASNIHFLFPCDPLRRCSPEDFFEEQAAALAAAGFTYSLLQDETLRAAKRLIGIPLSSEVIYRGWMLNAVEYGRLAEAIVDAGGVLFTSLKEYLTAHHLPNWYPLIPELTPETRVYPSDVNLVGELEQLGWEGFFVKDYVKSLKTSVGSLVRNPSQAIQVIEGLKAYRGDIEGGICVRRAENFLPMTEVRYFVVKGIAYGQDKAAAIPDEVRICTERIPSPFFSVDVVQRDDGKPRVVEIGDGQVSDLVGWSPEAFADMWTQQGQ